VERVGDLWIVLGALWIKVFIIFLEGRGEGRRISYTLLLNLSTSLITSLIHT